MSNIMALPKQLYTQCETMCSFRNMSYLVYLQVWLEVENVRAQAGESVTVILHEGLGRNSFNEGDPAPP